MTIKRLKEIGFRDYTWSNTHYTTIELSDRLHYIIDSKHNPFGCITIEYKIKKRKFYIDDVHLNIRNETELRKFLKYFNSRKSYGNDKRT